MKDVDDLIENLAVSVSSDTKYLADIVKLAIIVNVDKPSEVTNDRMYRVLQDISTSLGFKRGENFIRNSEINPLQNSRTVDTLNSLATTIIKLNIVNGLFSSRDLMRIIDANRLAAVANQRLSTYLNGSVDNKEYDGDVVVVAGPKRRLYTGNNFN